MSKQYNIPLSEQRLCYERAKRRAELREIFLRERTNPRIHATGEGGYVFDPAVQRYIALKINSYEHFRPTFKNFFTAMGILVVPLIAFGYIIKKERDTKEHKFRTGQVAYKDRLFKFI